MRHYRYEMTCPGCPEQYDVWKNDTRVAYIRYRWGYLRVCPYLPDKFEVTNEFTNKKSIEQELDWDTTIYERSIGDDLSGVLPDNMREKLLDEIDNYIWKYWNEGTYMNKDGYNIYIKYEDMENVEDVTEEWKENLGIK